ncbi:hypothetical protein [Polluticoccus soli]|uniref:hypothetical protein n=1 Tax=Polluticoccus soli TaxID=3034150 RepID=UPI0023E2C33A|nr:hypothetical protein [Flavipsychrobacter sp. JY13-12]
MVTMISKDDFIALVESYFHFLTSEFQFSKGEVKANGNAYYSFQFQDNKKVVSISHENIGNYYQVIVYLLDDNGSLPNYDDKTKTLHLDKLNKLILPNISLDQIKTNNTHFSTLVANSELERKMLKSAKELRLCLQNFDTAGLNIRPLV